MSIARPPATLHLLVASITVALGASDTRAIEPRTSLVVQNCLDAGPGSLRQAVIDDPPGEPVDLTQLTCSTITLTSGAIETTRSLTLTGPGSANLTIDGNHHGAVFVQGAAGSALSVQGMTLTNGYVVDGYGGCIFSAGSVVLDDVVVTGCEVAAHGIAQTQVFSGGGVEARGDFSATDSKIVGNSLKVSTASAQGGGIRVSGDAMLVNTTISGNSIDIIASMGHSAEFALGGGAYIIGTTQMTRSSISNNSAYSVVGSRGAGIYAHGALSMGYSTLSDNSATGGSFLGVGGGGIVRGELTADHSNISGNAADQAGGISANFLSAVRLQNSTVSGNIAHSFGGMQIYKLYAYNSTIAFNGDDGSCGGVYVDNTFARLTSTIVYGNFSSVPERANICGPFSILGAHDLIGAAYVPFLPNDTLRADPLLAPLADNGGPTLTHALLAGSPAIDTGIVLSAVDWDQRGDGYPRTVGNGPDIGAYEASLPDQPPAAVDDVYTTDENVTLTVSAPGLLANDIDPDGDAISVVLVDNVANGSLTLNADGSLVYVPTAGFFGSDQFTYEATDGSMISNLATVTIHVLEAVDNDMVFVNGFDA